ncbi:MAG: AMP-binding protein, partial [Candidatus Caenarcaniphilales bacterium]|nr:AMP-binding protein [Candidatus Caenarcaniphilales bacterium]
MQTKNFKNLPYLFYDRAREFSSIVAFYYNPQEGNSKNRDKIQLNSLTWQEVKNKVDSLAAGLISKGLQKGERVGILANTRYEWAVVDIGTLSAGGILATYYHTCTPEELIYLINDSGAKYLFVEDKKQLDKIRQIKDQLGLKLLIVIDNSIGSPEDKKQEENDTE